MRAGVYITTVSGNGKKLEHPIIDPLQIRDMEPMLVSRWDGGLDPVVKITMGDGEIYFALDSSRDLRKFLEFHIELRSYPIMQRVAELEKLL